MRAEREASQHVDEDRLPHTAHETQQKPALTLLPIRHTKIVHLVRHGQGYHNVAGEAQENLYKSWDYEDAHLTEKGWQQAAALKKHIAASGRIRPEVIIVSPLTRAMETAVGAFGGPVWHEGDAELPLMAEVAGGKFSTAHPAVSSRGTVPFVAYELCREHLGEHPCDKRRSLHDYRQEFPGIDFSQVKDEEDVLWKADVRETDVEIAERGYRFLQWVSQRPETEVAVVCHSSILHFMLSNFARDAAPAVQKDLRRFFANCELRTVTLSDSGSDGGLDPTWFHPDGFHEEEAWQNGAVSDGSGNGAAKVSSMQNGVA